MKIVELLGIVGIVVPTLVLLRICIGSSLVLVLVVRVAVAVVVVVVVAVADQLRS